MRQITEQDIERAIRAAFAAVQERWDMGARHGSS
jgi:hypothetical protein